MQKNKLEFVGGVNVTYKEHMIKSLSDLLEDGETLYYPIYGTLLQKNHHWFGYFGLIEQYLLIVLLQGSSKKVGWANRVPLDIKKVTVKRYLIPLQYNIYIEFNEGEPGSFRVSKKVYGIESQEQNIKGFIDLIQNR